MKGFRMIAVILLATASSCGLFVGNCPPVEEDDRLPVRSGVYLGEASSYDESNAFQSGSDHALDIDRSTGKATITLVDADGRLVELQYQMVSSAWDLR